MTRVAWALAWSCVAAGCTVPNSEHCLHQKPNGHAWCSDRDRSRTFCSPCAAAHDGCVAQPPSAVQCPEYEPPDAGSGSGSESASTGASSEETAAETGSTTAADPAGGTAPR
jgi:hypothetical protein